MASATLFSMGLVVGTVLALAGGGLALWIVMARSGTKRREWERISPRRPHDR